MTGTESLDRLEDREALEKALASRTFARSEQLRSFLRYVCEAEFGGRKSQLSEYLIGVEVLHRPSGYSPSEDSSVRTRAYELRQKLDKLYASELLNEPVHIYIPKGTYSPVFTRVTIQPDAPQPLVSKPEVVADTVPAPKASARRRPLILCACLLAASLLGALGTLGVQNMNGRVDPVLREAWAPFAKRNETVLFIAATPQYLVLGPQTHQAYATATYPAPPEAYALFRQHRPLDPNAKLGMIFTDDALGVGSMDAVVLASEQMRALGASSQILPERPDTLSVVHGRDAVLFGAPVDSEAISELLEKTPLTVAYDESVREFVIKDRVHRQLMTPEKASDGQFRTVYGLVTVLNTRESDRSRLGLVIFSGITSIGTHGAAEFFTSPRLLQDLRSVFGREGYRGFPPAYQVVVKCRIKNMMLFSTEYCEHRVIRNE